MRTIKFILLLSIMLPLSSYSGQRMPPPFDFSDPVPKFKQSQHIIYEVPDFYLLVCSGKGVIIGYEIVRGQYSPKEVAYHIRTPEPDCPGFFLTEDRITIDYEG